jgi:transposase InsO family protein
MAVLRVSERRACRVIGQPRATQRYPKKMDEDEEVLREQIVSLASQYGRYGYRRITAMLRNDGWPVNHKRVERIWRQEGLKVPSKQPKRSRLWLKDGSIVRLRPEFPKYVWSYDFMQDRTHSCWICFLNKAYRSISGRIMGQSLSLKRCATFCLDWMLNPCLSNHAARGRMATSNPSMARCGMNCFQERSSIN